MSEKQRDIPIGSLVLRHFPGYGEQVVLLDALGKEVGSEVVGYDVDGYAVAVRDAFVYLIRQNLPEISNPTVTPPAPSYRRVQVAPAELEKGMLVEIGDTGSILGEVALPNPGLFWGEVTGLWADGRSYDFDPNQALWVRIPN